VALCKDFLVSAAARHHDGNTYAVLYDPSSPPMIAF